MECWNDGTLEYSKSGAIAYIMAIIGIIHTAK